MKLVDWLSNVLRHLKALSNSSTHHQRKRVSFIAAWAKSPLKIGAILPSSRALAHAMAQTAAIHADNRIVVELGAGTGMVTQALVNVGITSNNLIVVEREALLLEILAQQFPTLCVVGHDAQYLDALLQERNIDEVGVVVSSLPLLTMPRVVREKIESQMVKAIGKEGTIVQFTYGSNSPIPKTRWAEYHIYGQRITRVLTNIPPAKVWIYQPDRREKPRD